MLDLSYIYPAAITVFFSALTSFHYFSRTSKKDIAIATIVYSVLVFHIVYFVSFENNLGLGIGLLGILSLVRLRSTPENPIDIGHIFYAITIGLLNATINDLLTIIIVNGVLTIILVLLSSGILFKWNSVKTEIVFDDLESQELNNYEKTVQRIRDQFGIEPYRIKITKINYLKDTVTIEVTYHARNT